MSTRDKLLKQATKLFAQKGYDGTATEAIVSKSGVNKRMLYHYFGSKEGLYREVLQAQWSALAQVFTDLAPDRPLLDQAVDRGFDYIARHPEMIRLIMWEGLRGGQTSRRIWASTRAPLFTQAAALLQSSQLDGRQLLISLLGALSYYFAFAHTLADALETDPLSEDALAVRKAHIHALISLTCGS